MSMSINDFEEKRLENRNREKDLNHLETGQNSNRSDKKLLLGTVQFYEDILYSLSKSMIIVFNRHYKHIEVWGNSDIEKLYGIKIDDFKSKVLTDVFPSDVANDLKNHIKNVFDNNKTNLIQFNIDFPNGNFWLEAKLTSLVESSDNAALVIGYFKDITETKRYEKELIATREICQKPD